MSVEILRVLVVDDDAADRKQVLRALKQSGLSVQTVEASGMDDAMAVCQEQTFDCAIVDYHMPGQNGLSVISAFQAQFPYMATIMVTGQGDEVIASEVIKRGAGDYIPKDQANASYLRRTIEYALEKSGFQQKLDHQREELQNFSCVLAHDLKAPIRHIRNMIGLIQEKMVGRDQDEEVEHYMTYVCSAANTMDALVDALTSYTKFDAEIKFHEVNLQETVAHVVSLLEGDLQEKGATVIVEGLPPIIGHEPQIIQLFQNLIANALKYNESDHPTITISAEPEHGISRIMVHDNGIGISERHTTKIFEPFKRLHGKDSPYAGSGLGLATCKKIVERHGGTITCESSKGQGATFSFTLPVSSESLAMK